jgi:transposase
VHLNLAYRWFCRLGLEGKVPDHSTFSKNRTFRPLRRAPSGGLQFVP